MKIFKSKKPVGEENGGVEGERSVSSVNNSRCTQAKIINIMMLAAAVAVAGFFLFQYYATAFNRDRPEAKDATRTVATQLPPLKPMVFPEPIAPAMAPAAPPAPPAPNLAPQTAPQAANGQPQLSPAEIARNRRLQSPVFFSVASPTAGAQSGAANSGAAQAANGAPAAEGSGNGAAADAFAQSFQPSRMSGASAYLLADPSLMITKGSVIPCTVVPAIDSTLAGIVTCIQSADVWSADGKVLLLERGTRWIGEQKTGLAQGQQRLGMLWTRGQTPEHVLIDVDSGTADELGRPGVAGTVDTKFWDRFSGAILVSLIGDVGSFLAATQSGGSSNTTAIAFSGTVTGAQNAMSDIIKSTISIPPTLTKNQGANISIFVARDLDFRSVYSLEAAK